MANSPPNCQNDCPSPSLLLSLQSFRYVKKSVFHKMQEKESDENSSSTEINRPICKTPEPADYCGLAVPETPESLLSSSNVGDAQNASSSKACDFEEHSDLDEKKRSSPTVLSTKLPTEPSSESCRSTTEINPLNSCDSKAESEDHFSKSLKKRCSFYTSKCLVENSSTKFPLSSNELSSSITKAFQKINKRSNAVLGNEDSASEQVKSESENSVLHQNKKARFVDSDSVIKGPHHKVFKNYNKFANVHDNGEISTKQKNFTNTSRDVERSAQDSNKIPANKKIEDFTASNNKEMLKQLSKKFPNFPSVLIQDFMIKNHLDVKKTELELISCCPVTGSGSDSDSSGSVIVFPKKGVIYSSEDEDPIPSCISGNERKGPKKGVVYSSEEEEEENSVSESSRKVKKGVVYSSEEEELTVSSKTSQKKSKGVIYSSDDEDQPSASERRRLAISSDEEEEHALNNSYGEGSDSEDNEIDPDENPDHKAILKFFEEASLQELLIIPGCSKKKAEIIMSLKPFESWSNLIEKFQEGKFLSLSLLDEAKKVLTARGIIENLMNKCEDISKRMSKIVTSLMENCNSQGIEKQPSILCKDKKLASYQLLGLNWLALMKKQNLNGILADEMGLGKTVQIISYLAHELETGNEGPHLIVVPASTLDNWEHELKAWCPDLKLIMYYGSQLERRTIRQDILFDRVEPFNILLTTYNMVISNAEDRSLIKAIDFDCVIFDEAHLLKNMASQRYKKLMKIRAARRFLLTGTPLQNNLVELMSLLIFVMPHMFESTSEEFIRMFSFVGKSGSDQDHTRSHFEEDKIELAKRIMRPFVLRRLKKDVLQDLPNKSDQTHFCSMSSTQEQQYKDLVQKLSQQVKESNGQKLSSSGVGMMMQLRKLANHPLLLRYHYTDEKLREMSKLMLKEPTHYEANDQFIFEDMQVMHDFELHRLCNTYKHIEKFKLSDDAIFESGKIMLLEKMLPELKSNGHRVLIFSQFTMMMDILEAYLKLKEYKYLRFDGSTKVTDRQVLIDQYMTNKDIFIFLLSTKAGGLGINLTAANTVIIHDIDVNPYNDKQAEDRCHRVGQTRPVSVSRFISKGTIEEMILNCTRKKMKLEQDITSSNLETDISTDDMASLLKTALGL